MLETTLFKEAYKYHRKDKTVYKGFGFQHLSDGTPYYIHPNNQSFNHTTTLAQSISEAIILFSELLLKIQTGKGDIQGSIYYTDEEKFFELNIPDDWYEAGVFPKKIGGFRGKIEDHFLHLQYFYARDHQIVIEHLEDEDDFEKKENFLVPLFLLIVLKEYLENTSWYETFNDYLKRPGVDLFVKLHEDLYQNHKNTEYWMECWYDPKITPDKSALNYEEQFKIIKENTEQQKKRKVIQVESFPENHFSPWQKELIPHLSEEFQIDPQLNSLTNALVNRDVLTILFHGSSGTGKTIACKLMCQNAQLPLMATVNATEDLDEFILGKYIPSENQIIFKESQVTQAIRYGGAVVFEEINFAKPQYLAFLNSLLDDNGFVRLDNGEIVRRHPDFRFFATMNIGYFGTKELNQALFNRFNVVVELDELSDEAIKRLLLARVPESEPYVTKILGVYHKIKNKLAMEELDYVLSPRNLENWAKLAKYEGYLQAANHTILSIAKNDKLFAKTMKDIIMLYKW